MLLIVIYITAIVSIIVASCGLFLILCDVNKIPTIQASKAVASLARRQNSAPSGLDLTLDNLSEWLADKLPMSDYKREQMQTDLDSAGETDSPEMFRARQISKSLLIFVLGIPLMLYSPWMLAVSAFLGFLLYLLEMGKLRSMMAANRKKIENDLPNFVANIEKMLPYSHDVIYLCESYIETAMPELKKELVRTVSDMRSGSVELALTRLERRVNSSMLSEVCRGLLSVMRGDATVAFWANLGAKLTDLRRQQAKMEALKMPGKVRILSLSLYICFILIWGVVMVTLIIDSVQVLF